MKSRTYTCFYNIFSHGIVGMIGRAPEAQKKSSDGQGGRDPADVRL
jgi:hypothetical protein